MNKPGCIAALALLVSCRGEDDELKLAEPLRGAYEASYTGSAIMESGVIFVGSSGGSIYWGHRHRIGFGDWSTSSSGNNITFTMLSRVVDEAGNEFPAAFGEVPAQSIALERDQLTSSDWILTKSSSSTASLEAVAGNWQFSNLYIFDARGERPLYSVEISIATDGTFTGSDSNGCDFSGWLSEPVNSLLPATIDANNCGATMFYIDNYRYQGFARLTSNGVRPVLEIIAVNRQARRAVHFQLF